MGLSQGLTAERSIQRSINYYNSRYDYEANTDIAQSILLILICVIPLSLATNARISLGNINLALFECILPLLITVWLITVSTSMHRIQVHILSLGLLLLALSMTALPRYVDKAIYVSQWRNIVIPIMLFLMIASTNISLKWNYRIAVASTLR